MRVAAGVVAAMAVVACRYDFDEVSTISFTTGAQWTDYLALDGSPCDLSSTPYSACVHGGEIRTVTIMGLQTCDGLDVTDALGAFDWTCTVKNGVPTFESALKPDKGLRDLVTADGWLANHVTVAGHGSTEPSIWWTNPVLPLPDGSGVSQLALGHAVYVLDASRNTDGYTIAADHVSVVTLGQSTLTYNNNATATIIVDHVDAPWLELTIDAIQTRGGLHVDTSRFAQVYRTTVLGGANNVGFGAAIELVGVTSSRIRSLTSLGAETIGVLVGAGTSESSDNYIADLQVTSAHTKGLYLNAGTRNLVDGVTIANCVAAVQMGSYCDGGIAPNNTITDARIYDNENGLSVNSEGNRLIDATFANNNNDAIVLSNNCGHPWGTVIAGATIAFSAARGINLDDHTTTILDVVALGNATGVSAGGQTGWANLVATDSTTTDVDLLQPSTFDGNLIVTGSGACTNTGGYAGVTNLTCAPTGASTATVYFSGSTLGAFVGPGPDRAYPESEPDWLTVGPHQAIGQWNVVGRWTAGNGALLDLSLRTGSSLLGSQIVAAPNEPMIANAPCPAAVDGNRISQNHFDGQIGGYTDQTYLSNAIEIVSPRNPGYGAGNHDGLCESGEQCLYAPNLGAYQGSGAVASCEFADGTVTGVTMYGYSDN
jgi:hypothetical protein